MKVIKQWSYDEGFFGVYKSLIISLADLALSEGIEPEKIASRFQDHEMELTFEELEESLEDKEN